MIRQTKSIPFVIAFAALMMAIPFAQTAFAVGSTSSLNLECGVTTPTTIAFGAFSLDTAPGEFTDADMTKLGGEIGTFEVTATDWLGVATKASSAVTVLNPVADTDVITIDGIAYTATTASQTASSFIVGATNAATATNLATAINLNSDAGTVTTDDVDATAQGNTVILRSSVAGTNGNAIALSQTTGTGTLVVSASPFSNGQAADTIHMLASNTKYKVTVNGDSSASEAYATKTALDATGVVKTLAAQTEATTNLKMSLEINPITANMLNLPYSGALTQTLTFTSLCNQAP